MNHKKYPIHVYIFIIIVIIVLIATIFSARKVGQKLNHAKIATTKVKIKILNSALEQFKNDHGYYPKDGLIALIKKPEHVRNSGKLPDDPWNNSFQYKLIDNGQHFMIWSSGPDKISGTEDDIYLDNEQ